MIGKRRSGPPRPALFRARPAGVPMPARKVRERRTCRHREFGANLLKVRAIQL
jgi:hypothetical protein